MGGSRRGSGQLPLSGLLLLGHYAWFKVVRMLPSSTAAIATLGIPVVGVFSSALVLREPVGLGELAALALVVSGLGVLLARPGGPGAV